MTGENLDAAGWALLENLFDEIKDIPELERIGWMDAHCPDPDVRATLEGLLQAEKKAADHSVELHPDTGIVRAWLAEGGDAEPADRVGPYLIEEEIGLGGTSRVFRATREKLGGRVALKLLRHDPIIAPEALRRFEFEHRLLARLEHPHIARLLDAGVTKRGVAYLAMEYVDGKPITEYCRELELEERLQLFLQVCEAVAHTHRRGIIHRDLKPGNIFVSRRGNA